MSDGSYVEMVSGNSILALASTLLINYQEK